MTAGEPKLLGDVMRGAKDRGHVATDTTCARALEARFCERKGADEVPAIVFLRAVLSGGWVVPHSGFEAVGDGVACFHAVVPSALAIASWIVSKQRFKLPEVRGSSNVVLAARRASSKHGAAAMRWALAFPSDSPVHTKAPIPPKANGGLGTSIAIPHISIDVSSSAPVLRFSFFLFRIVHGPGVCFVGMAWCPFLSLKSGQAGCVKPSVKQMHGGLSSIV